MYSKIKTLHCIPYFIMIHLCFQPKEDEYSSIVVALQARIEVLEVENRQVS